MKNALKQCNNAHTMTFISETAEKVLENLSTAILLFDADLSLVCINASGEDMLSVSSNRVDGLKPRQIWPKSAFFNRVLNKALDTGAKHIERGVLITLNNNSKIRVDAMITPILDDEKVVEVLVELVDSYAYEKVLQEHNQKALQEAAKEAVQGMAHEIKNPLGGIRGAAQLLEAELHEQDLKEYTHIIVSESDRLRNFIDKMLSPSKSSQKNEMNIHEVLEYVVSLVRAESTHTVKIIKNYDPSIPDIVADREQLIQAVLNLVRNAVQAIDKNGSITLKTRIRRKVTINNRLNRHVIVLEVIDDGPGIPPEIEHAAFYPMITTRAEGTGLGLTLAQQIIQAHDGLISYERENDKTFFTILLPLD